MCKLILSSWKRGWAGLMVFGGKFLFGEGRGGFNRAISWVTRGGCLQPSSEADTEMGGN